MRNVFVFLLSVALAVFGCAPVEELDTPAQTAQAMLGGAGVTLMMYRVPCPTGAVLPPGQTCRAILGGSVWEVRAAAMPQEGREVRLGNSAYLGRRPGGALIANAVTRFGFWATYPVDYAESGCRDSMWIFPPWDPYPWRLDAVGSEIKLFDGVGQNAPEIVSPSPVDYYLSTVERVVSGSGAFAVVRCSLYYGPLTRPRRGDYPGDYTVGFWERLIESQSATQ